jgi:hypothetical protein
MAMAIKITTAADETGSAAVLKTIVTAAKSLHDITPRTLKTLQYLARNEKIAIAFDGPKVIGWVIAEPLNVHTEELGMAYVMPAYRKQDVLKKLIALLENQKVTQVFATYSPDIMSYMNSAHGFTQSSLIQVSLVTNGRFLTKRLSPKVIKSIGGRLKRTPALYAIRRATK